MIPLGRGAINRAATRYAASAYQIQRDSGTLTAGNTNTLPDEGVNGDEMSKMGEAQRQISWYIDCGYRLSRESKEPHRAA
jgi:hypothetical protein